MIWGWKYPESQGLSTKVLPLETRMKFYHRIETCKVSKYLVYVWVFRKYLPVERSNRNSLSHWMLPLISWYSVGIFSMININWLPPLYFYLLWRVVTCIAFEAVSWALLYISLRMREVVKHLKIYFVLFSTNQIKLQCFQLLTSVLFIICKEYYLRAES